MFGRFQRTGRDWCLRCGSPVTTGNPFVRLEGLWVLCAQCAEEEPVAVTPAPAYTAERMERDTTPERLPLAG